MHNSQIAINREIRQSIHIVQGLPQILPTKLKFRNMERSQKRRRSNDSKKKSTMARTQSKQLLIQNKINLKVLVDNLEKVGKVSSKNKFKSFLVDVSEKMFYRCLKDSELGPYFNNIKNPNNYMAHFRQYLEVLFLRKYTFDTSDISRAHACGIKSRVYSSFKILLCQIVTHQNNQKITMQSLFKGCKIIENLRNIIATENQFFHRLSIKETINSLGIIAKLNLREVKAQKLVQFLFNCTNFPNSFAQRIYSEQEYLWLKTSVFQLLNLYKAPQFIIDRVSQNFRFVKNVMLQNIKLSQYLSDKKLIYRNLFERVKKSVQKESQKEYEIFKLLIFHVLDDSHYSFSHAEIIKILKSNNVSKQEISVILGIIVRYVKEQDFPQILLQKVKTDCKNLIKIFALNRLQKTHHYEQLFQAARQQFMKIYKRPFPKMCMAMTLSNLARQKSIYTKRQIALLHKSKMIYRQEYKLFEQMCIQQAQQHSMQVRIKKLFQRYQRIIVTPAEPQ